MEDDKQGRVLMTKATKQICHSLSFSSASIHPSPPHPMPIFLHACCNGVCCLYQLESLTGGSVCDLRRTLETLADGCGLVDGGRDFNRCTTSVTLIRVYVLIASQITIPIDGWMAWCLLILCRIIRQFAQIVWRFRNS